MRDERCGRLQVASVECRTDRQQAPAEECPPHRNPKIRRVQNEPRKSRVNLCQGRCMLRAKRWRRRSPEHARRTKARVNGQEVTAALCADPSQSTSAAKATLPVPRYATIHGNHCNGAGLCLASIGSHPTRHAHRELRTKSACDSQLGRELPDNNHCASHCIDVFCSSLIYPLCSSCILHITHGHLFAPPLRLPRSTS